MYPNNEPRFSRGEKQTENEMSDGKAQELLGPKGAELLAKIQEGPKEDFESIAWRYFKMCFQNAETAAATVLSKQLLVANIFQRFCGEDPSSSNSIIALAYGVAWREQERRGTGTCPASAILRSVGLWYKSMYGENIDAQTMRILSIAVGYALITTSCVKEADFKNGTIVVTKPDDYELGLCDAVVEVLKRYDMADVLGDLDDPDEPEMRESRERCMKLMFTDALPFDD